MIFLKAYTENNFGDDLFVHIITGRYPGTRFVMIAPKEYRQIFKNRKNLIILDRRGLFCRAFTKLFKCLKTKRDIQWLINKFCCGSVYIGGSIFIQNKQFEKKALNSFYNIINKRFTAVIGCNFGPFEDEEYINKYRSAFSKVTDICFRDLYSYNLFKDLKNVRYKPDAVFCLNPEKTAEKKKQIFISVMELEGRAGLSRVREDYINKITEIINYFTDNGYNAVIASFCSYEGDEKTAECIMNGALKHKDMVSTIYYGQNVDTMLSCISHSEYVIATRFHAMILGAFFNCRVFPLVYSRKMTEAIESYGLVGYIRIENINELDVAEMKRELDTNDVEISSVINAANGQFEKLDEFINTR